MCGIFGAFGSQTAAIDPVRIEAAFVQLRRRGPDSSGLWRDGQALLGHTRLSIIDLSSSGTQPMNSADGRFVIVFNGEVYNHLDLRRDLGPDRPWRGTSDTETLVEAYATWGAAVVERLNGMFAFAIWDRVERQLFIARDRLGVKPLYFCVEPFFAFASRPVALNHLSGRGSADVDAQAIRLFLQLGYVPAPYSLTPGVHKLPPAHCMIVDRRRIHTYRYWDYRHLKPLSHADIPGEDALVEQLDQHVRRSVRLRLLADVPVGTFLSGGVDSALIAATMAQESRVRIKTFTIGFDEKRYDESAAASRIADHIGTDHHTEVLRVADLLQLLPDYLREFDEPQADATAFSNLAVARMARQHVSVALSGDGADELFGGYHHYDLVARLGPITRLRNGSRSILGALLRLVGTHKARLLAGAMQSADTIELYAYLRSISKDYPPLFDDTASADSLDASAVFAQAAASFAPDIEPAETAMRVDLATLFTDGYLQKLDLATMAYSLEGRCPYTDYGLVEWAMRLPIEFKIRPGIRKCLQKKLLERYLPRSLVHQPKRGFVVPLAEWLRGPLRSWAQDLIEDRSLAQRLPLEVNNLRRIFAEHCSGRRNAQPVIWAALMLLCHVARQAPSRSLPDIPAAGKAA